MTISIRGLEHPTLDEAFQELNFTGDQVIGVAGRYFTVSEDELQRIEELGIQPTIWHYHEASQRIICVPGKH